jgi:hypothetical protein
MVPRLSDRSLVPLIVLVCALPLLCAGGPVAAQGPNSFAPVPGASWHDLICLGQEVPLIGDFNGDGADDVAVFVLDTRPGGERGGVWVALSDRARFGPLQKWASLLVIGQQVPLVGDFNGDGKDDVAVLLRDSEPEPRAGDVYVALSTGTAFATATKWQESFCAQHFTPMAADVDGDGKCDLLALVKSTMVAPEEGDVYVALSEGDHFDNGAKWHDFMSISTEVPILGDFNGDGRVDIGTAVIGASGAWNAGAVYVALSEGRGRGFGASSQWLAGFSRVNDRVLTGDVNGDGKCDLIGFSAGIPDPTRGAADLAAKVNVALSDGTRFAAPVQWHSFFCLGEELPRVGDFNGDHNADIATFTRDTAGEPGRGDVFVALAARTEAVAATPTPTPGPAATANLPKTWLFRARRMICAAGNEGGDEPYFAAIGFRSRFGTPGSTRILWSRNVRSSIAENLQRGGLAEIPPAQGEVRFDNVTIMKKAEIDAGGKPEVLGVVLIAMERDSSDPVEMVRTIGRQADLWGVYVADYIERAGGVNAQTASEGLHHWLFGVLQDSTLVSDDLFTDDDDHVGNHLWLWVAAEPDCTPCAIAPPPAGLVWPYKAYTEGFLAPGANDEMEQDRGTWVWAGDANAGFYIVEWRMEQQ